MQHATPFRDRVVRVLAATATVAVVLLGIVAIAAPAEAAGVVSGHLIDQVGHDVPGLKFYIHQNSDNSEHLVQSDSTGHFSLAGLDDSSYHFLIIGDTTADGVNLFTDDNGDRYENNGNVSFFAGSDLGDIVMNKFVPISGTISNWSATMGSVRVDIYDDAGGTWHQLGNGGNYGGDTTTSTFSFTAPISAAHYTLRFQINGTGPYLDAYLGGAYDDGDASVGTQLTGVPGVGFSGLTMTMPAAALVTGRVTTGGSTPLANILVWAQSEPDENEYDEMTTGVDGLYSLRVRPGVTNSVHAEDDVNNAYVPMTYDKRDGCGCVFDPVVGQIGTPAQNIDFDLLPASTAPHLLGLVAASLADPPLGDIGVRLFRSVGTGWVLSDVTDSDTFGPPNFGFDLSAVGNYRLQFVDTAGTILTVTDGFTAPHLAGPVPLDPVPACFADLGYIDDDIAAIVAVDQATPVGSCGSLAAPSGSGGGSGGSSTHHHHSPVVIPQGLVFPAPTPSATPTPSSTPSPSSSPSSSPTPVAKPPASGGLDLWWLLWLVLGVLVLLIIVGAVVFIRRR